jgi:hypothetical protein
MLLLHCFQRPHVPLLFNPRGRAGAGCLRGARGTRCLGGRSVAGGCLGTENVRLILRLVVAGTMQGRFPDASTLVTAEDQVVCQPYPGSFRLPLT